MLKIIALLWVLTTVSECVYNKGFARQMAYFSAAAYESAASIRSWTCTPCKEFPLTDVHVFNDPTGTVQAFVGHSATLNAIVLSFRGSANTQNWIANIDARQTGYSDCSNCAVHQGFWIDWLSIRTQTLSNLQALKNTYRTAVIYVTGHSLGGALSILSAVEIKKLYGAVGAVYNFGQPRVGNAQFATYYQATIAETYRVIHYGDIVPHLPPAAFGFRHSSNEIWYDEPMNTYKQCLGESPNCSDSLPPTSLSTSDHDISNYLKIKA